MTSKTLAKAKAIVKAGGVERTGVRIYRIKSTSGEEYGVVLGERAVCTCPSRTTCSHIAAAEIVRARRLAARHTDAAHRMVAAEERRVAEEEYRRDTLPRKVRNASRVPAKGK